MTFLEAAETVLRSADEPMHVRGITDAALAGGLIQTEGQTPSATMGAMLAVTLKKHGDASRFVRTAPSTFGLREWVESGQISVQAQISKDDQRVRVPHFPTYAEIRKALPLLNGVDTKTATGMQSSIHAQMGNPKANKDWSDPDSWIPDCLTGNQADLAIRIWQGSDQTLNPRHLRGKWLLIRRFGLLAEGPDGILELTPQGLSFLDESDDEVERQIDESEGTFKILSLVAELGPARKGALLEPWRVYLSEVSTARSESYTSAALYARLRNLRSRGYVNLEGSSYSVTESGLRWLDDADLDGAAGEVDLYQQILELTRKQKIQIQDNILDILLEMDPYEFEKLIAQLLESMGYDDCEVTPRGGDKGIDVVATYGVGLTSIRVVVQVKRARANVQRPILDGLRGSLHRFGADRGTIITTGGFSRGTREAATEVGVIPITLIDGQKLVKLLTENCIGIRKKPIELWELDPSAFSGEDDISG